jgi:selenocysteine lyase/cysteine desulfurase
MSLTLRHTALDVVGDDLTVELPNGAIVAFAHLDHAATAPCVRAAADAVQALLPRYGSVHRGAGIRSQTSTAEYERAREVVGGFVGARPGDTVVFTRNTTDALNLLARALPAEVTTIVFDGEHHANLLPWRRSLRLPTPDSPEAAVAALRRALRPLRGPALLAVTGASNVTGEIWPVRRLADVAHAYGARVVVDAAQLAPHAPIDLATLGADYLALSGHKLYAPFGAGVLAGRADWLDAAEPYLCGGGASASVGAGADEVTWARGPARHEAGTPNLLGAVSLAAVCAALARADRVALHEREQDLLARLREGLTRVPGVVPVGVFGDRQPRVGIVSLALPAHDASMVADRLAREYGIGVRAGQFCAHPLSRRLAGTALTAAGTAPTAGTALRAGTAPRTGCGPAAPGLLRASFGLGTTDSDVDRLVAALGELTARAA